MQTPVKYPLNKSGYEMPVAVRIVNSTQVCLHPAPKFLVLIAACMVWLGLGSSLYAQPTLVKDINTTVIPTTLNPKYLTEVNGIVYFSGYDTKNGHELWRSDGTQAGTYIIKDIKPGSASSVPENLINVNGTLFFTANYVQYFDYEYKQSGFELWKSDGTIGGTVKIKEMSVAPEMYGGTDEPPIQLINANGTLYFTADNFQYGYNLWKSNGTAEGTMLVRRVELGRIGYSSSSKFLASINNIVYFTAASPTNSEIDELWKTDGTPAGTLLIKSAPTNIPYGLMDNLTPVNNTLFFTARDATNGNELWKTNGTPAGTTRVKDIYPGNNKNGQPNESYPAYLTNVNGTLYLTADNGINGRELWKSDGTDIGTVMVKDIYSGPSTSSSTSLVNVNGVLFFNADNGINGNELWKSNGTAAGTVLVKDINPGTGSSFSLIDFYANPPYFANVNGTLYFVPNNDGMRGKLWKSNGTEAGTILVKDLTQGTSGTSISNLINVNGMAYFSTNGELFKSNGTDVGTVQITTSNQATFSADFYPQNLTNVNGILFFTGNWSYPTTQLWKSNGTEAGTVLVKDFTLGNFRLLTNVNGTLYFFYTNYSNDSNSENYELWKSDGTTAGTIPIISFPTNIDRIDGSVNLNGLLYFTTYDYTNGYGLWKSNGTSTGTILIKNFNSSNQILNLTAINNTLYFTADDGISGNELWKSNGTTATTVLVKDMNPGGGSSSVNNLINLNGILYFNSRYPNRGLWKSDGTTSGTVLVNNLGGSDYRYEMINANGMLYFTTYNDTNSNEIWKSDGTTAGTILVKNFGYYNTPANLTHVNGVIYFTEQAQQVKLWKSNGTIESTVIVKEIEAYNLNAVGNTLVFFSNFNLWRSNGTDASTEQVSNLSIQYPTNYLVINNMLFFNANDGKTGNELWKYDPSTCTTSTQKELLVQGSTTCNGQNGTITIKASQSGVLYQAYVNNSAVGSSATGTGGDITLTIPAASLVLGDNIFTIQGSGCTVVTLINTAKVILNTSCPVSNCTASGSITREVWNNIAGSDIAAIPLNTAPSSTSTLTTFETSTRAGDNYGQRIRGYLCAPSTGNFTFYIAGDDKCELYLSSDEDPAKKVKIASVSSYTGVREWNKMASQKSNPIALVAGKKYYIEALHKEGLYADNLAVGWQSSSTSPIEVIPGSNLSPYVPLTATGTISRERWDNITGSDVSAIPLNVAPTIKNVLTSFETPTRAGDNYGQRIRGYVHPTTSGSYTFYIAGDDRCELYLSTDEDPLKKTRIASVGSYTGEREWNKLLTQKSKPISLLAGKKYYIEALHKEGLYADNLAVGWQTLTNPITVIPGANLSPYVLTTATARVAAEALSSGFTSQVFPNPFDNKLIIQTQAQGTLQVSLLSALGRNVYQATHQSGTSELVIDFSQARLKGGMYLLQLQTEGGKRQVIRVVKK